MSFSKRSLGRWGEKLAGEFLEKQGYRIIERNLRTAYGEIDLIGQEGNTIVFVEVKTRSTDSFGPPEASITPLKKEHIIASAQTYLQSLPNPDNNWRIDVIAIRTGTFEAPPEIIHFKNAIN